MSTERKRRAIVTDVLFPGSGNARQPHLFVYESQWHDNHGSHVGRAPRLIPPVFPQNPRVSGPTLFSERVGSVHRTLWLSRNTSSADLSPAEGILIFLVMSIDKKGDPCRDASPSLLESYNMYGWSPDIDLSVDENFMEVMLLVTRNSTCLQGYMGCILVDSKKLNVYDPNDHDSVDALYHRLVGAIIGVSTNQPLYTVMDSDVHAEIGAIGQAARLGNATAGCTAFITMPPCKTCFGALAAANVKRVVTEREPCQTVLNGANKAGIEIVVLSETSLRRTARVNELTSLGDGLNSSKRSIELQAEIEEKRKRRKELRQEKKRRKQERHERAQLS